MNFEVVIIPPSVTRIKNDCFQYCPKVKIISNKEIDHSKQ